MANLSPIIKPTNNCNLACRYCYVSDSKSHNYNHLFIMSDETLENSVNKILNYNDSKEKTEFTWHGGEPLIAGTKFFEKVLNYQKTNYNKMIVNTIQTNLTLLDDEKLEFLLKNSFEIGTSIDGSEISHNKNRIMKSGKGTFDLVYENLKKVKDIGLKPGVVVTLNKYNLDEMKFIYEMFKELRVNFRINPVFFCSKKDREESDFSITPKQYGEAMMELFDLWFFDKDQKIEIDTFTSILSNYIHRDPSDCEYSGSCQDRFLLIDPYGDVYPCDKLDAMYNFKMGNIVSDSLEEILNSEIRQKLRQRNVNEISECKKCDYKDMCNGGCMYDAYVENGDFNKPSSFCEGDFLMFDHIKKTVDEQLEKARVK